MKNITKAFVLLALLSPAAYAQTKTKVAPKPRTEKSQTAKPSNKPAAKSAATKSTTKPDVKSSAKHPVKAETKKAVTKKTETKKAETKKAETKKADTKKIVTKKAETKFPSKPNAAAPFKETGNPAVFKGEVAGKTYTNGIYNFAITLPDSWEIAGDDFEKNLRQQGFDLNPEAPKAVDPKLQPKLNQMAKNVSVLLNAVKYVEGSNENAVLRVSVEDLQALPQVKDAVDYFDLMRETYKNVKLPGDFKYSETQAERLGKWQFGFLDTSNKAGKKRMYATVRNGYALMFTVTYKSDEDLAAIKNVLAEGNFKVR